jgi:NAD(P)-dependent dehydrogenase (short-subunit alcohol dehydrogenase family)
MDLHLTGKKALVTGASSGLGEAIAILLAAEGATVVVHGRDLDRTARVAAAIKAAGGTAETALGDLATDAGADTVARTAQASGPVDILVNNAGAYDWLGWADATAADWAATYETNVISGVRMIQRLVPAMRERGWGRVIQIGGGGGLQPHSMQAHYHATLAARHNLAVSLARDLKDTGITSNVVSPGAFMIPAVQRMLTDMAPERGWGEEWNGIETAAAKELIPNDRGRFGRPSEVAAAVAYLTGPAADYISGATLRVDGGNVISAF